MALQVDPEPAEHLDEFRELSLPELVGVRLPPELSTGLCRGLPHRLPDGAHPCLLRRRTRPGVLRSPHNGLRLRAVGDSARVVRVLKHSKELGVQLLAGDRGVAAEDVVDGGSAQRERLLAGGEDDEGDGRAAEQEELGGLLLQARLALGEGDLEPAGILDAADLDALPPLARPPHRRRSPSAVLLLGLPSSASCPKA